MTPREKTPGQLLYEQWCGSSTTDRAHYFTMMNRAQQADWERLAREVGPAECWRDDTEPIHLWFSLSYANYLVLPRSVLQSMPQPWQARFCTLLDELQELFGGLDWPTYDVRALAREPEFITEYPACERCDGESTIKDEDDVEIDCPECDGAGHIGAGHIDDDLRGEHRYEAPEEVGFRDDPIPHYNRGRTRLEPKR